ncbi:hypothetical protein QQF73_17930 [Marinobacter sp. M216]|uniref:SbsA Ig-like domain-containing protein n=1 Tax=Marinobacter albus TaxID=3030833 RepID=A0ABT7HHN4_9GAMM|nr:MULTISPECIES: hypothetical protein [unclassified Marinobacter]MBW7473088.1 hypothetical protein [Marinobacter sp. F4218]MDK9559519.1 hypothetical protein [Marinobacter sp. M216]
MEDLSSVGECHLVKTSCRINRGARIAVVLLVALLLHACGGGSGESADVTGSGSVNVDAGELSAISKVVSLSRNYVEIEFADPVDPEVSGNPLSYNITLSNGNRVAVVAAYPGLDGTSVLLQLAPEEEDVQLIPNGTLQLDLANVDDEPILFIGDGSEEPRLLSVVSLSDAVVFLQFSEPVSDDAGDIKNYRLTSKSGNGLKIEQVLLGGQADTVVLTTESQEDAYYDLELSGVTGLISGLPLYMLPSDKTFLGMSLQTAIAETPSVVSAASLDNTHVQVTFSKPMSEQTPSSATFSITQANVNPESGVLGVIDARFASADRRVIELTTRSQSELTYQVAVTNATDMYGQQLKVNDGVVSFGTANTAIFAGTPAGAAELVDSDGDGLYDSEEQAGTIVVVEMANGEIITRQVTSDPNLADTDGDGLDDFLELQFGMNPRATDTDGDGIHDNLELNKVYSNPFAQDSDLDGLQDGFEHFDLKTSPVLADTDGDQLDDYRELFELNRDPRIADVPKLTISVGDVRLQLDERFSYTDETGEVITEESNTSTTLTQSENTSFTRTDGGTDEWGGGGGFRTGLGNGSFFGGDKGVSGGIEVTGYVFDTNTTNWQTDNGSARESQEAYERSQTKGKELSSTQTVTREVIGASIDVPLSIANEGNVPFTLRNLEITVLQQIGGRDTFLPVATLVPSSELATGSPLTINLGGSTNERGPFLFSSREVFPNLVESLMRNPASLVFRVANYDVEDELGRNYTFISQVARDRTGSVVLDYGDASAAENYLLATAGVLQDDQYLGGFSPSGRALGLPLSYLVESTIGLPRHQTNLDYISAGNDGVLNTGAEGDDVRDEDNQVIRSGPNGWLETKPGGDDYIANPTGVSGIIAGLNKTADSIAQGDDIQLVPVGTSGVSLGTIVIGPGENGVLDTPAKDDDIVDFIGGFETSRTCSAFSENAGAICRVDGECLSGTCSGPQKLVRIKSLRNGDFNRGWVILTSGQLPDAANFDQITVEPGDNLSLAFLQDLDGDGLFARNEFLFGSTDSERNRFDNRLFGPAFSGEAAGTDDVKDSVDSDQDGLSDFAEVFVGWKVAVDGGALRQTFSSPRFGDTDGDGLWDVEEQDLRGFCEPGDSRAQALCAFQSDEPVSQADAIGIIAGPNNTADTTAEGDDEQLTPVGAENLAYGTPVVGPGPDGQLNTDPAVDDVYEAAFSVPPATDPAEPDTDRDGISDFTELGGFDALLAIVDGGNGEAESLASGDDIQRAFINNPVPSGNVIVLPGTNSAIDSTPGGDDVLREAETVLTDPLRRDTDDDSVADGSELVRGSDPTVDDRADFFDADQDGLTDGEEDLGWLVSVNGSAGDEVTSSKSLPDTDFDGLPDFVERDLRTNPRSVDTDGDTISDYDEVADLSKYLSIAALYPNMNITSANTGGYGTDPTKSDTDGDDLSDQVELISGSRLSLPGETTATTVFTSPIFEDTDLDDLNDGDEIAAQTDPTNADTDGDGRRDGAEIAVGTDPLVPDVAFRVIVRDLIINNQCKDASEGSADVQAGEVMWWVVAEDPQTGQKKLLSDALDAETFQNNDDDLGAIFYQPATIDGVDYEFRDRVPVQIPDLNEDDRRACYYKRVWNQSTWLQLEDSWLSNSLHVYSLKPGESFGLQAAFLEADEFISDDCGVAPNFIPSTVTASELHKTLRRRYSYDDLVSSSGISLTGADANDVVNNNSCSIDFRIDIEIVR